MILPSFRGGVHPNPNKDLTKDKAIESFLPSGLMVFPMRQHIGVPNKPAVAKGDKVKVGTVLGSSEAFVSAPVLSSVSGTVKDITMWKTIPGTYDVCVVVENDGLYERDEKWAPLANYETCDPKEYLKRIREAGIVGYGGATFPTAVKYTPPPKDKIRWFIANGAECEPYLNCDYRLMLEATDDIVNGMRILMRLFPDAEGIIAVENNKPDAIKALKESVERVGVKHMRVKPLRVKYPQGAEKMLIEALTGQEYPFTTLPADVGCLISNVRTIEQCWRAIALGEPSTTRIVTVSGDAIEEPKNVKIPLGTSIQELVDFCGGFKMQPLKVLAGGPMVGMSMRTLDVPAVKGTAGIIALTSKSVMHIKKATHCIRCGKCTAACPMHLLPVALDAFVTVKDYAAFEHFGGMNCIECGCCGFVCPAYKPLTQSCRAGKIYVIEHRKRKQAIEKAKQEAATAEAEKQTAENKEAEAKK